MKKYLITAICILMLLYAVPVYGVSKLYKKTSLTGGTSADLDGIDGAGLNDGDIGWVFESNVWYLYYLDADLGESESSPTYIVPDTNPGSKVWVLQGMTILSLDIQGDLELGSAATAGNSGIITFQDGAAGIAPYISGKETIAAFGAPFYFSSQVNGDFCFDVHGNEGTDGFFIRVDPNNAGAACATVFSVTNNQRVGVGTITPEGLFEVEAGDDADAVIYLDANSGQANADTWIIKSQAADNDLTFTNHTTERMRLTDAGILDVSTAVIDSLNYAADTASDDDYIIALTPALTAYATGLSVYFDANNPNTGACTLNINSVGAASIKMLHDQDPNDNCIEDGSMVHVIYDGTNWQMMNPCAN